MAKAARVLFILFLQPRLAAFVALSLALSLLPSRVQIAFSSYAECLRVYAAVVVPFSS